MEETKIISRPLYENKIAPYINKSLVKILTGQRRVGKSYILKSIAQNIRRQEKDANILSINLEEFAFSHIKEADALYNEIVKKIKINKKNYIFIDEIQEVADFEKVIRSLILDEQNDVYITGSNSRILSTELSTLLAGRSYDLRIHPLSYSEFLLFHKKNDSTENLQNYIRYGGLPYLIHLPDAYTWNEYLTGVTDAVVFRDIISRHKIRNVDFLQRLLLFAADNIGQLYTAKKISDYLKSQRINVSVAVVQNYVEYLEEAIIVNKARRWDIEGKRFFEIGEKLFFEDHGIRNSIIGYQPDHLSGLLENVIFNHLCIQGYKVKIGVLSKGHEVDFVAEKDGEVKYIQEALTIAEKETFDREFGNLISISDNYEKLVITLNDSAPNTYKGIRLMSLREFLLTFN